MTKEDAKAYMKVNLESYLNTITSKAGTNKYICPLCNSGSGNNNKFTAAFTVKGELWHCFSCNAGGDIYNLIAKQYNLDSQKDFAAVFDKAVELFNITVDEKKSYTPSQIQGIKKEPYFSELKEKKMANEEEKAEYKDYTSFLIECKAAVKNTDYFYKRGLSDEIINKFALGYITKEILDKYRNVCSLETYLLAGDVIIPYNNIGSYWIARETQTLPNEKRNDSYMKWKKPKTVNTGKEPIFNEYALDVKDNEPIFITEAPLDSLSIIQAGGSAIAIGGTGIDKLSKALESRPGFSKPFILAFDNPEQDKGGRQVTEQAKSLFESKGIPYISFKYKEGIKDCNAYLIQDRQGFYNAVHNCKEAVQNSIITPYMLKKGAKSYLQALLRKAEGRRPQSISTGFTKLDKALDGGLYPGLYCIGGISSLGKTTLMLQIADQIAKLGKDVLLITLEMSGEELVTKSLSRLTYTYCLDKGVDVTAAKTMRDISDSSRWQKYTRQEMDAINFAVKTYSEQYAPNIFIQEGTGDIGFSEICGFVEEHIAITGNAPVVIVDYLQILASYNDRATDKQNIDKSVLELKRLSRDKAIPVIAVSSFNRDNYNHAVNMAAFKESGAIEYSSDVLLAIQPQGMRGGTKREVVEMCKSKDIRDIELVILKNRNGASGEVIPFRYYACYNYMKEIEFSEGKAAAPDSGDSKRIRI